VPASPPEALSRRPAAASRCPALPPWAQREGALEAYSPDELTQLVWGLGTSDFPPGQVRDSAWTEAGRKRRRRCCLLKQPNPQTGGWVAGLAPCALLRMEPRKKPWRLGRDLVTSAPQAAVAALAAACAAAAPRMAPAQLAHVVWHLPRLGADDPAFYLSLAPQVRKPGAGAVSSPPQLPCDTLCTMPCLARSAPPPRLTLIHRACCAAPARRQVVAGVGAYGPAELADVARVYARLALHPPGLFEALAARAEQALGDADLQVRAAGPAPAGALWRHQMDAGCLP
jgi:hypothetical protein